MLVHHLSRIPEFAHVSAAELRALANRARVLCLPEGRWLVRRERDLGGYLYLLRGSLRTWLPNRRLRHPVFGQLNHFYPGCRAVRTLSASQVLYIETAQRDFLMQNGSVATALHSTQEVWLTRFLSSGMMAALDTHQWRALLRAFRRETVAAGELIIRQGDPASACYVLEAGHAVIQVDGRTVSYLNPGDFFGEDALILGQCRNASVTALADAVVQAIDADTFERLLLRARVQPVAACGEGRRLNIGERSVPGTLRLRFDDLRAELDKLKAKSTYYVLGGRFAQRELVAFLLCQRGLSAYPLMD